MTPTIANEFVKRIVVHAPDKSSGKRVQKVDIVWNFIGMVDFPNEPQGKNTKEKNAIVHIGAIPHFLNYFLVTYTLLFLRGYSVFLAMCKRKPLPHVRGK